LAIQMAKQVCIIIHCQFFNKSIVIHRRSINITTISCDEIFTVQTAAPDCNMKISIVFLVLMIVVCAMSQGSVSLNLNNRISINFWKITKFYSVWRNCFWIIEGVDLVKARQHHHLYCLQRHQSLSRPQWCNNQG